MLFRRLFILFIITFGFFIGSSSSEEIILSTKTGNCEIRSDIVITQEVSGEGVFINEDSIHYIPGKSIVITVNFTKNTSENILALGMNSLCPAGWVYQGTISGSVPPVTPQNGKLSDGVNPFEFAWITVPSFPFSFSFKVEVPSNTQGPCQIITQALFRMTGPQYCSDFAQTSFPGPYQPQEGEGTEEGLIEGSNEGVNEGTIEGTAEGISEGSKEGSEEGVMEGTPEGTTEGEGGNDKPKNICGIIIRIFIGNKLSWKHLLDFACIGGRISLLLGTRKNEKKK